MSKDKELRSKYNQIFENGVAHITAATLLANGGRFDFAISHIVLGIEELIKYQVMLNYFCQNPGFKEEDIKAVFAKHKAKHSLLEEFQISISEEFGNDFHEYIFKSITGQQPTKSQEDTQANRFKEIGAFLSIAYKDINLSNEDRKAFFSWLKGANDLKNKGFYVDYNNNAWWFPNSLRESDFLTALKFATAIKNQIEAIKSLDITDDEFIDFMNTEVTLDEFRKM